MLLGDNLELKVCKITFNEVEPGSGLRGRVQPEKPTHDLVLLQNEVVIKSISSNLSLIPNFAFSDFCLNFIK